MLIFCLLLNLYFRFYFCLKMISQFKPFLPGFEPWMENNNVPMAHATKTVFSCRSPNCVLTVPLFISLFDFSHLSVILCLHIYSFYLHIAGSLYSHLFLFCEPMRVHHSNPKLHLFNWTHQKEEARILLQDVTTAWSTPTVMTRSTSLQCSNSLKAIVPSVTRLSNYERFWLNFFRQK